MGISRCHMCLLEMMLSPLSRKTVPSNESAEKRIYNYRHSRTRRISENLFGILANKWKIFQKPLNLSPEKSPTITTSALVLHNFLRKSNRKNDYTLPGFVDCVNSQGEIAQGSWRQEKGNSLGIFSSSLASQGGRKPPKTAKLIRETFTEYFMNEGSVEWQWEKNINNQ